MEVELNQDPSQEAKVRSGGKRLSILSARKLFTLKDFVLRKENETKKRKS